MELVLWQRWSEIQLWMEHLTYRHLVSTSSNKLQATSQLGTFPFVLTFHTPVTGLVLWCLICVKLMENYINNIFATNAKPFPKETITSFFSMSMFLCISLVFLSLSIFLCVSFMTFPLLWLSVCCVLPDSPIHISDVEWSRACTQWRNLSLFPSLFVLCGVWLWSDYLAIWMATLHREWIQHYDLL